MENINKSVFFIILLTFFSLSAHAYPPSGPVTLIPASGAYLDKSPLDLTILVNVPGHEIMHVHYSLNGNNVKSWLDGCMSEGVTAEGKHYLTCRGLKGADFGEGSNSLNVGVYLTGGMFINETVDYFIIPTHSFSTVQLEVPGRSSGPLMNAALEPGYRYEILAQGEVSLWPDNPNFPIATPEGNGTTCLNSNCVIPGGPTGALVMRINNGTWFLAGKRYLIPYSSGGLVEFAINDHAHHDNVGSFSVLIKKIPQ